jgi:hypothetical protein
MSYGAFGQDAEFFYQQEDTLALHHQPIVQARAPKANMATSASALLS